MHRNQTAVSVIIVGLSLTAVLSAQDISKVELFGGYSYLHLTKQSNTFLGTADLNGWNASVKLNVKRRVGLVADLSGHYGRRETISTNGSPDF